jgi:hypothetical protein
MKPVKKLIPIDVPHRKTNADFMRWLKKRRALEKLEAAEETAEATKEMKEALMVWVDDGGPPA